MAIRQIRKEGDDILKKKSKPIKEINPATLALVDDMLDTLRHLDGVGIAAPQIGMLKRIVIVDYEDELYELINPEIMETDGNQVCNEACLSVKGRCGDVDRPMKIKIQALNRKGEPVTLEADEFLASAFCHEIDHLDGVLFLDKARNIQLITEEQMRQRKKGRKKKKK